MVGAAKSAPSLVRVILAARRSADNVAEATYLRPDEVRTMLRLWLIAMLAAGTLAVVRDHDLMHRTGLLGHCAVTHSPTGAKGSWQACDKGVLNGRPDLSSRSCRS